MKKVPVIFLPALCCMLFFLPVAKAQRAAVSVDNFSGSAGVNVPIMNFQYGSISVPIGISYNGSGVKVKDAEGSAGMGWNLYAGGQVSRQVRGIPDDVHQDMSYQTKLGWIRNSNGTKINSFNIANDNDPMTLGDDMDDYNYINANFSDLSDTEPDIFYVSAPGLNCKLVFDNNKLLRTIPYQDIKVSYLTETSVPTTWEQYGRIKSFTITTSAGLTYVFDKIEQTTKYTSSSSASTIQFFKHEFDQYEKGFVYTSAWKLGSITDLTGHALFFYYETLGSSWGKDRVAMIRDESTSLTPFTTVSRTDQNVLKLITADDVTTLEGPMSNNAVRFGYTTANTSGVSMVTGVEGPGKTIVLGYTEAKTNEFWQKKTFLSTIYSADGITRFDYHGLSTDNPSGAEIALPDSTSKAIDLWGYYNGGGATSLFSYVYINPADPSYELYRSMPVGTAGLSYPYSILGADRSSNATYIANGSLKSVLHPEGGSTSIVYEPNDFYDPTRGSVTVGGGIRVKETIDYDGISTANNIVTNYAYINPATALSSGKALAVPQLYFTAAYNVGGTAEDQWQNSVIRLEENLSQETPGVAYSHVKVSRSGAGSSLFEYSLPATRWDASSAPDWTPTTVNVAFASGYLANDRDSYPFIPNTNYDFERGLLNKSTQFNEAGNKVAETSYTYERTNSPVAITGFKFDRNGSSYAYGKYTIYSSVGKLTSQVTNTVFDAPSTVQYNQTATNYYYTGLGHKMPTLVQQTNSDGSISRSYTKYLSDYNVATHSDNQSTAMYNLQQLGANFPIESYNQLERNSINKTIGASLVKLKPWAMVYPATMNLPVQQLSLVRAEGLSDFVPATVSGGLFSNDSRYTVKQNVQSYQQNGTPLTVDDNKRNVQTMVNSRHFGRTVAVFANASSAEIGYSSFDEYSPEVSFTKNVYATGTRDHRAGILSDSVVVSNTFSRTITMAVPRKSYVFSTWIKSTASGTVTITLSGGTSASHSLPFASTGGQWKYHEVTVPVTGLSTTFTVQFQTNTNILMDDVLFYPSDASVKTTGYADVSHFKTSETSGNGNAQYFENDISGRLVKVFDQDRNMLLKKSYVTSSEQQAYTASISSSNTFQGLATQLYDPNSKRSDDVVTYNWNFGDGSAAVSTTALFGAVDHVYTSTGTFTVTLTKTSAIFGTVTVTSTVTITANTTSAIITGTGDLTVRLFQGYSLILELSGSSLYSGLSNVTPGVYDVQVSTPQYPYSFTNPTGFKKWETSIYNNATLVGQSCTPTTPNVRGLTQTYNIMPGLKYSFSISENVCVIEEVQ